jgi:hypothetical protein
MNDGAAKQQADKKERKSYSLGDKVMKLNKAIAHHEGLVRTLTAKRDALIAEKKRKAQAVLEEAARAERPSAVPFPTPRTA